jgi:hypothetical protein
LNNKNCASDSNPEELEMKILIYAQHFPPSSGGMEFSNLEIAKGLHNLGHMVEVVTVRNTGAENFVKQVAFPVTLMPKWPPLKATAWLAKPRQLDFQSSVFAKDKRENSSFFP